ncbi:MAG: glycoside hydrolase family 2 [Actinomycetota bacterium]|nr:glycoside hydrolase family 2 [Actinomycetota bacterium]
MSGTPGAVHPRPQMVRDTWVDLGGEWGFAYDDDDVGLSAHWQTSTDPFDRTIVVPYPPESKLSGVHDPSYHPVVWYRRTLPIPDLRNGERLLLHFGAVDYRARVWVDGTVVGEHEGGHTPFTCDVTDALGQPGGPAVVVVRAEDHAGDVSQPRGKQDWEPEPHLIWYHRSTGIWQPVWLEPVPATHIVELQWVPEIPAGRVRLELGLNRAPPVPLTLRLTLRFGAETLAEQSVRVADRDTVVEVAVPALRHPQAAERLLWAPRSPTLVDADVELLHETTRVDRVTSYLGLRTVGTGDGRFLLNGLPYYLRGVLTQGYWSESHLAAPDADALRREVEVIKSLGFNAVRVHQKVEDPRFLYWCDRLGLLVWGEMPSAYVFDQQAVRRSTTEWLEVLRRDRSHPCIVTWVPINESWGVYDIATDPAQRSFATAIYHLTKAVDPHRPVISNDGWEHTVSDIWTVHDYAARGSQLRARYGDRARLEEMLHRGRPARRRILLDDDADAGQPVMLTEFGGIRVVSSDDRGGWGYSSVESVEGFADRLQELVDAVLDSSALAGFCYTQLSDTGQEQNGLLTADRRPKIPPARVSRIVRRPARAVQPL